MLLTEKEQFGCLRVLMTYMLMSVFITLLFRYYSFTIAIEFFPHLNCSLFEFGTSMTDLFSLFSRWVDILTTRSILI